jgi:hypothetical protein
MFNKYYEICLRLRRTDDNRPCIGVICYRLYDIELNFNIRYRISLSDIELTRFLTNLIPDRKCSSSLQSL